MKLLDYSRIEKFIPFLEKLLVFAAIFFTSLLLFKNLYYYEFEDKIVDIFYNVPMIFLLFIWMKNKIKEREIIYLKLVSIDIALLFFVSVRMFGLMYHSGHVLFLVYSFLTTQNKFYRTICAIMFIVTLYFKFFFWTDFITPTVGLFMALFFVWLRNRIKNSL